ncbi:hypothetical protein AB0L40_04060 [Patulibacter sp. NPDC049589]
MDRYPHARSTGPAWGIAAGFTLVVVAVVVGILAVRFVAGQVVSAEVTA